MQPPAARGQERLGGLPKNFRAARGVDGLAQVEQPGEDARDVGVDDRRGAVEGEAGDGPGGVAPDAGERGDGGEVIRQRAAVVRDNVLRGAVQISRA